MAATLFKTSDLYLPAGEKKRRMAVFCGNTELCKITEDLVFTDPYRDAKLNHWTSPQLDDIALEFRSDGPLKAAAQAMKLKFLSSAEALVHGDLHSGSIMATTNDIRVIDPEFAFFGPMGFDTGALIANLILAYLSQIGHETAPGGRDAHRAWILGQTIDVGTGLKPVSSSFGTPRGAATPTPRSCSPTPPGERRSPRSSDATCAACSPTPSASPAAR